MYFATKLYCFVNNNGAYIAQFQKWSLRFTNYKIYTKNKSMKKKKNKTKNKTNKKKKIINRIH